MNGEHTKTVESRTEDERFKAAEPLELHGFRARVDIDPELVQVFEVNTGYDDGVFLTVNEARYFREWLDKVIP